MGDRTAATSAGTPHHVVHRRNDGSACFFSDEDHLVYLDCLKEAAERQGCAIHAYVLMPDHVQLLVSLDSETRLAQRLSGLGEHYVEYVNYTYQRNGAFWEEDPKITGIGDEQDLLGCYREIETAPVRARLAPGPADYRWSSHRHHACGGEDAVIRDHPVYLGLGTTQLARQLAYNELFCDAPDSGVPARIRPATGRDPALDASRLEDGIARSVRGIAWQSMNARKRLIAGRLRPHDGSTRSLETPDDLAKARASGARRFASK